MSDLKIWGTNDCNTCETGCITLYYFHGKCIHCDPSAYEERSRPQFPSYEELSNWVDEQYKQGKPHGLRECYEFLTKERK